MLREAGSEVSEETLERLRKKFGGDLSIKFNNCAQPDFSDLAEASISVVNLTGNQTVDAAKAWKKLKDTLPPDQFSDLLSRRKDLRFHHTSDDTMMLIDKDLHVAFQHTGPASALRNMNSLLWVVMAPGLSEIKTDITDDPANALEISNAALIGTGTLDVIRWYDPFFEDLYNYYTSEQAIEDTANRQQQYFFGHPGGARP